MVRRQPPGQPNAKAAKPTRRVFPAAGDVVRLELRREKDVVRFQVLDARMDRPRYLGQVTLGTNDIAAVKLFVSNRNGAEPLDVLWRDVTIRADRLGGLGTTVRTVLETVVYAEPTAIENGVLIVGGTPRNPPPAAGSGDAPDPKKPGEAPPRSPTKPPTSRRRPTTGRRPGGGPAPAPATPAPGRRHADRPRPSSATPAPAPAPKPEAKPKEPKARIPLDEVESIRFERTPVLAARFVGQKNVDLTLPAPAAKKDEPDPKGETKKKKERRNEADDDALAPPAGDDDHQGAPGQPGEERDPRRRPGPLGAEGRRRSSR